MALLHSYLKTRVAGLNTNIIINKGYKTPFVDNLCLQLAGVGPSRVISYDRERLAEFWFARILLWQVRHTNRYEEREAAVSHHNQCCAVP